MKKKLTVLIGLWVCIGSMSAHANVVSVLDWTGNLTVSGFSTLPNFPENPDQNLFTMTFRWEIDNGSSHTIGTSVNPLMIDGSIEIFLSPTAIVNLPTAPITQVIDFLPEGQVDFPPGFQTFSTSGSPITQFDIVDSNVGLNSTFNINAVSFESNVMVFELEETLNQPFGSFAGLLAAGDFASGNPDGKATRAFNMDITITEVPIPAGVWLFFTGFLALSSLRFKLNKNKICDRLG